MRMLSILIVLSSAIAASAADPDPKSLDFFEKKIRPALTEHCLKCHSAEAEKAKKLRGGLYLDSQAGWAGGGDSGPAIVPGKPKESLLMKSLHYNDDLKMPPSGKLPESVIKDFETWIATGAVDPRRGAAKKQIGLSIEEGKKFWSYIPVTKPAAPTPMGAWAKTEIDQFILAKLEASKLEPAKDADRATLARRLYFDLIGLPPSPEQIDRFVKDGRANALEILVDELLQSPAFGERWGRHWLDVARYAESVTLRGFIFKDAWRYRDYVIESFNQDVPYSRFIREQLAGDLLPAATPAERQKNIVATTYLMLGNTNLEEQDKKQLRMDFVDEQLDVVTKGLLGQTVTCARCHDHKFDPIPTQDYYALAGIFRNIKTMEHSNVSKWTEVSLPVAPNAETELKDHEAKIASLQAQIKSLQAKNPTKPAAGVLAVKDIPGLVVDDKQAKKIGTWQDSTHSGNYIGAGYIHDQDMGKGEKTVTFDPDVPKLGKYEVRLAYSPGTNRAAKVPVTIFSADGEKTIYVDMQKAPSIEGRFVSLGTYKFEPKGQSFVIVANEGTKGHVTPDAVVFIFQEADQEQAPPKPKDASNVAALEAELKKLQASGPKRPTAMAPVEEKLIEETRVHIRGLVSNLGDVVPRGVLRVALNGPAPSFPQDQSGRIQLADWIASPENPLTARVMANRVWHWLFGQGIVRTVDNFGTTGEAPSHPELLDYLANHLVKEGWSIKKLIRTIVLSRTYQQATISGTESASLKLDPENRLFGRANRKRLEGEPIRDALLVIGDNLNPERGGPTFPGNLASDYTFKSNDLRRSVYLPHFRNSIPELLDVFDVADPSMVTGKRNLSTVAPQALFLMNNPFVIEQAKKAATKLLAEKLADDDARVIRIYRMTLGREPSSTEKAVMLKYVTGAKNPTEAWSGAFHALFASADFRFLN